MSDPQNTGQMNGQGELRAVTTAARNFRLRLWLTNQLWITVLGLNMVAVMLSFVLPQLDSWLDRTVPLQSSTVETLFGALAGSMITFTGIVFSALFVAAQIQTSAYSPRLAAQLRRVLGSSALSDELRTRGHQRAAQLTWNRAAREFAELMDLHFA